MHPVPAVSAAADLLRSPARIRLARSQPLPGGVEVLLQIVAGEADVTAAAASSLGRDAQSARRAAEFFVEQVLLDQGSDHYRVLGASSGASTGELRRNMALLLRWLHPDIGDNADRAVYAGRVTTAWERLKTPERREAYDEELRRRASAAPGPATRPHRHRRAASRHPLAPFAARKPDELGDMRQRGASGILRRLLMAIVPGIRR